MDPEIETVTFDVVVHFPSGDNRGKAITAECPVCGNEYDSRRSSMPLAAWVYDHSECARQPDP